MGKLWLQVQASAAVRRIPPVGTGDHRLACGITGFD
jgi:hypothetical protein